MHALSEVLWTFILDYTKGWGIRLHQHDYFQIHYCISGDGTFFLDGQPLHMKENMCLLIHPNQPHELLPVRSGQLRIFDTKFYIHDPAIYNAICSMPQFMEIPDPEFRELCMSIRNEWASNVPERCQTLFFSRSYCCSFERTQSIPVESRSIKLWRSESKTSPEWRERLPNIYKPITWNPFLWTVFLPAYDIQNPIYVKCFETPQVLQSTNISIFFASKKHTILSAVQKRQFLKSA